MKPSQQTPCHTPQRPRGNRTVLLWIAFAAWFVTLFILSSIPGYRFVTPPFSWSDKLVHAIIFTTGAFLLATAFFRAVRKPSLLTFVLLLGVMILIGFSDEFHQTYTPGRSGNDPGDLLADALGTLIGIIAATLLNGRRSTKSHQPASVGDRAA